MLFSEWSALNANARRGWFRDVGRSLNHLMRPAIATATAASGAATLNSDVGIVTSEAITTAAGAVYTLTLTNSEIAAGDMVFASVSFGAGTGGMPNVAAVTPAAGSVVIKVQNIHASAAFNAAIVISFKVIKAFV